MPARVFLLTTTISKKKYRLLNYFLGFFAAQCVSSTNIEAVHQLKLDIKFG